MKQVFAFVLLVAMFAASVNAQSGIVPKERNGGYARVQSMGGEGGTNPFLVDAFNMTTNPAFAKYYSNFLWGDIGASTAAVNDGDGQFAGFNYSLTNKFTLGAILARNDYKGAGISSVGLTNGFVGILNGIGSTTRNAVNLDNNFQVIGAYALSDATVLGFGVAFASTQNDRTPASGTADKSSATQFGINVGLIQHFSKDNALDLALSFISGSAKNEAATTNKVSGSVIDVSARYFHFLGKGFSFVPTANFQTISGTVDVAGASTDLDSYMSRGVGAGLNYTTGDLFLAGGVSFMTESWTAKATTTTPELTRNHFWFPVWNLGAEFKLTDWMKARLGYKVATNKDKQETAATTTTKNEVVMTAFDRTGVTLGLGFNFGKFSLDATVNDEVLRQGFKNLSTGGVNTFGHISASYAF
ncbi:MAG: hypothetical protein IT278_06405 [Ignavibacteriaceae bacterium]|nr:hypothetical protein [Ignavibacteriaceae bacterium]